MAIHYRTQGLILKKEDLGEADRIFTIFSKEFGKLEILGKSIRKIKSKLKGGMELFSLAEIEFIQGKTYKTLTDVILIDNFPKIKKNLFKLKIAFQIAEILDNLTPLEERDEKIWQLLKETFEKLNNYSLLIVHCSLIYYFFLWNFFSLLGYKPELYFCGSCQKKILPEKNFFIPEAGGIICQKCFQKFQKENSYQRLVYSRENLIDLIKILRLILKKDWQILVKLKLEKSLLLSLKEISDIYLKWILESLAKI